MEMGGKRTSSKVKPVRGPLVWSPVEDHGYQGVRAVAPRGSYVALKTKGSLWALFFESHTSPRHLGCFDSLEPAKEIAIRMHEGGWPEKERIKVGESHALDFCPEVHPGHRKTVVGRYEIESDPHEAGISWDEGYLELYLGAFLEPDAEARRALTANGIPEHDLPGVLAVLRTHARELNAFRPPD